MRQAAKLAICSPIKNRAWCLPYYLECILALEYPKTRTALFFADDGSTDGGAEMLEEWAARHRSEYAGIDITHVTPIRNNTSSRDAGIYHRDVYRHIGDMRNLLRGQARVWGANALFTVDSDTLFAPDIVTALLAHKVPLVSSINYVDCVYKGSLGCDPPEQRRYINAGYFTPQGEHRAYREYDLNALLPIQITAGTYLMDKATLNSAATYEANLTNSEQGEDVGFCLHLERLGIPRFIDTTVRSVHIMEEGFLPAAVRAARRLWHAHFDICAY